MKKQDCTITASVTMTRKQGSIPNRIPSLAGGNPTLYGYVYNTLGEIDPFGLSTRPNNGLYHIFDVFRLDENLWLSSDAVQFNRANVTVQPSAELLQIDAQKLCILHNFAPAILGISMHYMHENTSRSCKAELLRANKAFIQRMNTDQVFRRDMLTRYPVLLDWLDNPKMSKSPIGLTWHHNPNVQGQLQLVDRLDHRNNHGLYHPDGQGGREKWGGGKVCR